MQRHGCELCPGAHSMHGLYSNCAAAASAASADAVLCQRPNAIRNQQSTMAGKLMCGHACLQRMMEGD